MNFLIFGHTVHIFNMVIIHLSIKIAYTILKTGVLFKHGEKRERQFISNTH